MRINYKEVKEIVLTSKLGKGSHTENKYTSVMKISLHKVSFKKTNMITKKEISSWSYETTSDNLKEKFFRLNNALDRELYNEHSLLLIMNDESFVIKINYEDGSHMDYVRDGNFTNNELQYLSECFKDFIPEEEDYPGVLD